MKTLATSPVTGELVQNNGANYNPSGSIGVKMVKYTAASGALVFSTGTNNWNRGLAPNATGVGEPQSRIQQRSATVVTVPNVNVSDGILFIKSSHGTIDDPTLSAIEVIPIALASPTVTLTAPGNAETDVAVGDTARATFSRAIDASTITNSRSRSADRLARWRRLFRSTPRRGPRRWIRRLRSTTRRRTHRRSTRR